MCDLPRPRATFFFTLSTSKFPRAAASSANASTRTLTIRPVASCSRATAARCAFGGAPAFAGSRCAAVSAATRSASAAASAVTLASARPSQRRALGRCCGYGHDTHGRRTAESRPAESRPRFVFGKKEAVRLLVGELVGDLVRLLSGIRRGRVKSAQRHGCPPATLALGINLVRAQGRFLAPIVRWLTDYVDYVGPCSDYVGPCSGGLDRVSLLAPACETNRAHVNCSMLQISLWSGC
jgi:hypothetical protein